jgi:hypothetical protein
MPNAERWTSDLLNSSTEQFVQSRGLGEMYQWSQAEPEGTQATAAPEGPPPTVTQSIERILNNENALVTIAGFEQKLANSGLKPETVKRLRKDYIERLGLDEGSYNQVLKSIPSLSGGQ